MYLSWCFYSKYENGKCACIFFEKSHITDQTEDEKRKFMSCEETSSEKGLYIYDYIVLKL